MKPPRKLLTQILRSLLPLGDDDAARNAQLVRVAFFVQGQLAALPQRIRWQFSLGMLGFRVLTFVRFLRPFTLLSAETQRTWVNQWTYGRVHLARQLFRAIRSAGLMAYYESPDNKPLVAVHHSSGIAPAKRAEVVVIGSGAGGAATALELASAGFDVLVLEEGSRHSAEAYGRSPTRAMQTFYRDRGMTPIGGKAPIGFVEGRCLGGSTEINSGIWHHVPEIVLRQWNSEFSLDIGREELEQHFQWHESLLGVGTMGEENWPKAAQAFGRGSRALGYQYQEVRRAAPGCQRTNSCAWGCPTGAKQGMSRSLIPQAEAAGARFMSNARALRLVYGGSRVTGVEVEMQREDGSKCTARLSADHVFVCGGPTQTPSLLRNSGIEHNIGESFLIHPFLKVAARFDHEVNSQDSVFPLVQSKEFGPDITLGGGFFRNGLLAMTLSENWLENADEMEDSQKFALFYIGVRGQGKGSVRAAPFGSSQPTLRYQLADIDVRNLSIGLSHMSEVLLAGGAECVYPTVFGLPGIRDSNAARRWLHDDLPLKHLSLTTVHAFSSCPIGDRPAVTAADAFGRVHAFENLYINDASMLPTAPGVNPQATVMALARRNVLHFLETERK